MVFSSALFLLYFLPAFLLLHFLVPRNWRNAVILLASIFFYAWGAPRFILVLIGSSFIDHLLAGAMAKNSEDSVKKRLLTLGVVLNIALLLYFKYANFFVDNINGLFGSIDSPVLQWQEVLLPIGISFFTFQKLSFLVDCYRGEAKAMKSFLNYLLFVSLFPQLIAGPIVRFKEIATQIEIKRPFSGSEQVFNGAFRFILGLAKKILIANTLGEVADLVFAIPGDQLTFYTSWIGILAYSFQIYFDFSGYSDMAIGLGLMMGFRIPENFNYPYIAKSITEFWRRWHMSLSRWMKDYLYIPLGGNRVSQGRMYLNLWIVFLISGFWHGASWNFVIWGGIHGTFLVLERLIRPKWQSKFYQILRIALNFIIVVFAWVFFRAEDLNTALSFISTMLLFEDNMKFLHLLEIKFIWVLLVAAVFSFIPLTGQLKFIFVSGRLLLRASIAIVLLLLSLAEILAGDFNPFIYFRF